jgi:mucin-19
MLASRLLALLRAFAPSLPHRFFAATALILLSAVFAPRVFAANNPVPFVDIVSPVSIRPGATGVTLTVRGTGFVSTSTVVWNGTSLTTTFVSAEELTASVPNAFVAAVGLGSVTVVSPSPGGGKSSVTYVPVAATEPTTSFPSTPTSSVTVGTMPQGLVTADFNGDGKLDLAVANNGSNNVSILLGNGNGTFTTKSTPAAGDGANWIAVGDFNGDGIPDLAVANLNSTGPAGVSILLGNGDGTFTLHSSPSAGNGPFAIVTGDFNGDGYLDLAVSNSFDGTVTILLGTGTGTFTSGGTLTVGNGPQQIVAGDFNNDGKLDLAVTNESDSTISVLLGNGAGGFAAQAVFSTGGSGAPIGLIAADFTGAGNLDLAAVNESDVAILLGNGAGSFTLHTNRGGTGTSDLIAGVTGDYNGDGILDLVVSDAAAGEAFLFLGSGSGNFGSPVTYTTAAGAFGVVTADFNGDGGLDLAVANGSANNVSIFLQLLPVSLTPTSLTFGLQAVGTPSNSQAVTLKNSTGGTLDFTTIEFTGTDSGDFSQTNTCGASIANGSSCTINVTFTPGASGAREATLMVEDNGANSPQTLALNGTGAVVPSMDESFNPTTVAVNSPSTVTFSITNSNAAVINASFTDALPTNLVVAATPNIVNSCGGTVTATAGAGTISFTNAALAAGTCSVAVNVQGTTDNVYSNSVTIDSTTAGNGNTSSASLTVINPPTIAKAFGASTIPLNGTTTLTFTISNGNTSSLVNGIAFTDTMPAGLVSATPTNLTSTCSGTATSTNGTSSVALTGSSLPASGSCTVSLNVTGTTPGAKNNSVQVTSTNAGTGNTSNASLTVLGPPVISKVFGTASIPLSGSTSLSFTIQNSNTAQSLSGVAFTDPLPAGLVIATPNGQTGTCGGGTITATQGANAITLSGATLAASSSCTFSVNVTGTSAGQQSNTTGAVTSTQGGTGGTASASLVVVAPPSIAKVFNPATIALNGTTALTFTLTNPAANTAALTGVAFTDTLPAGLTLASSTASVCGGALTTTAPTGIVLTGASIAATGQCQFSVTVTGAASGNYTNTTGAVNSTNGGAGNTATANLTVASPPTITKAFGAATLPVNGTTSLTFTITNPNTGVSLSGLAFTDNLPAGLVVAPTPNLTSTCGGTATAVAGASSASLSAGTLAASASCTVSLSVQGTTAGVKNNSVQVTSTQGGTGNTSNASVTVTAPPVLSKAFGAASVPLNGSTSLGFTIQNNNTTQSLSGIGFTDTLPAGLVISTPNGLTGTCGAGTIAATQGTSAIGLSGATLAQSGSCTFSVNVTGTAVGQQNNTTGAVTSTEGGTGGTASASIAVVAPPSIAKAFSPTSAALNGSTTLTFTVSNPAANTVAETGVAFTDTLPTGLVVATPNGLTNTCGGTATAAAGSTGISLTGASIATPNTSCTVHVNVTGTTSGQYTNITGAVSSTNGGTGNTASANLTVASPPAITKLFGATTLPANGTTSLTFNITNPNTGVSLSGLAFTDSLPAGLVVAATPNATNTCGGTATATAGASSASLSAGTLAASASCTVSLSVQGATAGVKNNSVQVTSTEGGTGNTSNASLTVTAPPVLSKAFGAASVPLNGSTSLSFTIQNNNTTQSLSGISFTDTLPAGLVISTPNGQAGTCGAGTIAATQGTGAISLTGATLAQSSSCTFSVNVTDATAGTKNNTTGAVTSTEGGTGGTASASINVVAPPSIAKAFNPTTVVLNGITSLTFTITNPAANAVAETGVAFTDTFPAGIVVATPNGLTNTCGGTATATTGSGSVSLTGGTAASSSTCTMTVNVTATASGQFTNTTGSVSATNGGTGNTASANLTVASAPAITKAFGAASVSLNGTTTLTFNITNPNTNVALTNVAFTDTFPAGLAVASTPGLSNTCGGTATAVAGAGAASLSGGTLAASASCTVSLNVQGATAGVKNNSVQVTSTEGGTGNTSNASLTVTAPPVLSKVFGAASVPLNGSTSLSFTIQNNNTTQSLSGIGFTDTLPAGLMISTPNGLTGTCGGGTITATQGTNAISLTGATLAQSSSCTFSANVTGTAAGQQNNTTSAITSTQGGTGSTASASIAVVAPPSIADVFNPTAIALNTTSSLTFTITNPAANTVALTGVAFTNTLPAGLTVASATATVCGGTLTTTAPTGIVLTGASIAAGSQCQFSVTVTGAASGNYTSTTGAANSTNGGTGNTATANLTVASPPAITKAFGAAKIPLNGSTTLTFTVNNPAVNTVPLTGVSFTDSLPAGLAVSTPNGLTGTCGGGAITAAGGTSSVSLAAATLAAGGSCTFAVNVTGTAAGVQNNSVTVSSSNAGTGNTSNASVIVVAPPTIQKSFGSASLALSGSTSLTFAINNPNASTSLTGIGFTDALPPGLVVSSPNGLTGTCGGGTITATAGSGSVSLTGATLAASASCSFAVNVTGIAGGTQNNVTGAIASTEGGTGTTASASIAVLTADLTITKSHVGDFKQGQTGAMYSITASNQGTAATVGAVTVVDNLPSALTATAFGGTGWTCVLGTLTCTRSDALAIGASYPVLTLTVNVSGVAPASVTNTAVVSGGGETNTSNDTATDVTTVDVVPPDFSISMTPTSDSVKAGVPANYTITLTPLNNVPVSSPIVMSVAGLPAKTSSTLQLQSVTPGSHAATDTFVILTTEGDPYLVNNMGVRGFSRYGTWMPFVGLLLSGLGFRKRIRKKTKQARVLLILGLACCGFGLYGCASARNFQKLGTPPGTYTITVTGTLGNVQHSATVSLTVQP